MKRRPHPDESGVPARLRRYDPADWPAPECHPECAFWQAVHEWREARPPDDDTTLEIANGPAEPWHPERI